MIHPFTVHRIIKYPYYLREGSIHRTSIGVGFAPNHTHRARYAIKFDGGALLLGSDCLLMRMENGVAGAAWGEDIKKFTEFSYCNLRGKFSEADITKILNAHI